MRLTYRYNMFRVGLLFLYFSTSSFLFAENKQKVETVSRIETGLLQKKDDLNLDNHIFCSKRYNSLLNNFRKTENQLLAYKNFFANWDIPIDKKNDGRISRDLFKEIEKINKNLQESLSKIDKIRLAILLNNDLKENHKDLLLKETLQLKNNLSEIKFIPEKKISNKAKILDINISLRAIILDLGIENNVFEGSRWIIRGKDGEILIESEIFLVSRKYSLAQVIKGNMKDITINNFINRKINRE